MLPAVKVDEDLPSDVRDLLKSHHYDAVTVLDEQLGGSPDHEIWRHVQEENRILLTADLDFSDIRTYRPFPSAGIVLLRPKTGGRRHILDLLKQLLQNHSLEAFRGTTTIVTIDKVRTYRFD